MKHLLYLVWLAFAVPLLAADTVPPAKYSLTVATVYPVNFQHPEWVFIIGGTAPIRGGEIVCRTPADLKTMLRSLPRGSTMDWWPTCFGDAKTLAEHQDELVKICNDAGVVFTIHPSG